MMALTAALVCVPLFLIDGVFFSSQPGAIAGLSGGFE
jgi:hypothetical protein